MIQLVLIYVSILSIYTSMSNALINAGDVACRHSHTSNNKKAWGMLEVTTTTTTRNELFSTAQQGEQPKQQFKKIEQPEEEVVRRYFEGVNETDSTKIRSCFAKDSELRIRDVCGINQQYRTVNANNLVDRCMEFLAAHPDCIVDFHYGPKLCSSTIEQNDDCNDKWVIAHWYETGTWSGKSCGIEPTFEPMAVEGQTRFKINQDNLIEELVVTRTFTDWEQQQQQEMQSHQKVTIPGMDATAWENELSLDDLQSMLKVAEQAARSAGKIITSHKGCCSNNAEEFEVKSSTKDVVTQYDNAAQIAIEEIITEAFPQHSFLGEEMVDPGAAANEQALVDALGKTPSGFLWICDPIDGTANFASGLSMSAVTMGIVYKGIPIVGVVYDPHSDEMFTAIKGQGAYCNGMKLQAAQAITHVKDAIINAGCPADPNAFAASMRGVLALNAKSCGIRIIACSALTTAWIASGRLTAHFGYDLSSWDLIAGALLIQEAGGKVTDLDGSMYNIATRNMLCSNEKVHDQILDVLTKANAVSFHKS